MVVKVKAKAGFCLSLVTQGVFTKIPSGPKEATRMLKAAAKKKFRAAMKSLTGSEDIPTSSADIKALRDKMVVKVKAKAGFCLSLVTQGVFTKIPQNFGDAVLTILQVALRKFRVMLKDIIGVDTLPTTTDGFIELQQRLQLKITNMVKQGMLSGRGRRRKVSSALKRGLSKMQKLAAADAEQLLANSPAG